MLSSYLERSVGPAVLAMSLMIGQALQAEAGPAVQVDLHRTKAGHPFHYAQLEKAKEVAIIISWPTDWLAKDGAVATPYVGSNLMLSSGAGERDAATLAADFQDLNADGHIDDTPVSVRGILVVRPGNLALATPLGRDVLLENHLDERWLKRVKQNLKASWKREQLKLATESWDTLRRAHLGDSRLNDVRTLRPLGLIDEVTLTDIETWHAETFRAAGMTITAAGPIDAGIVGEAIDRLLDGLPAGGKEDDTAVVDETPTAGPSGKTILLHKPDAEKTLISAAGRMPLARGSDHVHDLFAAVILGSGLESRLSEAVRTRLRASYAVGADIGHYDRNHRLMFFTGEVEDRHVEDAYAAFEEAYEKLRIDGVTADEFALVKEKLVAQFEGIEKQANTMARRLMSYLLDDDPMIDHIAEMPAMVEALALDDVNAAIRDRLPAFDDMQRLVTGPDDDAIEADCVITSIPDVDRC